MLLSICMPTYNRKERALAQAINIISQIQTIDNNNEIEFIISDNASTDYTNQYLIDNISIIPSFVKIIRQDKNSSADRKIVNFLFNFLLKGEYVWIIGDDDLLNEGAVKSLF